MAKKYYYNEDYVHPMVCFYLDQDESDRHIKHNDVREKIMREVKKVVSGVIFQHKFTRWEEYDELLQHGVIECMSALEKFNPLFMSEKTGKYATTFNYFSLTAYRACKFYTMREKTNRDNLSLNVTVKENGEEFIDRLTYEQDYEIVNDDFNKTLLRITPKPLKGLAYILIDYIRLTGGFNKRDFFRFSKSMGWSPNLLRKFLLTIQENREEFYF